MKFKWQNRRTTMDDAERLASIGAKIIGRPADHGKWRNWFGDPPSLNDDYEKALEQAEGLARRGIEDAEQLLARNRREMESRHGSPAHEDNQKREFIEEVRKLVIRNM